MSQEQLYNFIKEKIRQKVPLSLLGNTLISKGWDINLVKSLMIKAIKEIEYENSLNANYQTQNQQNSSTDLKFGFSDSFGYGKSISNEDSLKNSSSYFNEQQYNANSDNKQEQGLELKKLSLDSLYNDEVESTVEKTSDLSDISQDKKQIHEKSQLHYNQNKEKIRSNQKFQIVFLFVIIFIILASIAIFTFYNFNSKYQFSEKKNTSNFERTYIYDCLYDIDCLFSKTSSVQSFKTLDEINSSKKNNEFFLRFIQKFEKNTFNETVIVEKEYLVNPVIYENKEGFLIDIDFEDKKISLERNLNNLNLTQNEDAIKLVIDLIHKKVSKKQNCFIEKSQIFSFVYLISNTDTIEKEFDTALYEMCS
jgi:hypothetical protein